MSFQIVIEINCEKKLCGLCRFQEQKGQGCFCELYELHLHLRDDWDGYNKGFMRCPKCLEAEGKIARLLEIEKEHWEEHSDEIDCNTCPLNAWEACDEICRSKRTLIKKIAELAEENEANEDAVDLAKEGMGKLLQNLKDIVDEAKKEEKHG